MDGPNLRSRRHEERTVDGRHAAWDRRRHSTVKMVAIVSEEAYAEDFYSRGKTVEVGGELALVIARIGIAYRRGGCLFYFFAVETRNQVNGGLVQRETATFPQEIEMVRFFPCKVFGF